MKTRALAGASTVLFAAACAHVLTPPPAVFPMTGLWTMPVPDGVDAPPVTDGSRLFVAARTGGVMAFDLLNGDVAWESELGAKSVTAVPGSLVVTTQEGSVLCVNPRTAKVRWSVATAVGASLPPVVEGNMVVVAGHGMVAMDLATGNILWKASEGAVTVAPAVTATLVLTGEADGAVRCRDRTTGASRWTFQTGAPLVASATVDSHPRVLVGTAAKAFVALDTEKGRPAWRWKLGADVREPPVVFEDSVLFASHEGVLYALNRGNGHLNWRAALPGRPLSGPLVYDRSVLVACFENQVVGFDVRTGRPLGVMRTTVPIRSAPILVGAHLFVVQRDRTIAAHALNLTPAQLTALPDKAQKGKSKPRP